MKADLSDGNRTLDRWVLRFDTWKSEPYKAQSRGEWQCLEAATSYTSSKVQAVCQLGGHPTTIDHQRKATQSFLLIEGFTCLCVLSLLLCCRLMLPTKCGDRAVARPISVHYGVTHTANTMRKRWICSAHTFTRFMGRLYFLANKNDVAY
jgi:hypothetical protein